MSTSPEALSPVPPVEPWRPKHNPWLIAVAVALATFMEVLTPPSQTLAAYIGMPSNKANSVAGIINFMRNMGSSVGTSMVTTLLARRAQFHQTTLLYHTTMFDPTLQNQVKALSQQLVHSGASPSDAQKLAYGLIYQSMRAQAQTLAYIDTYMLLAIGASIMLLLAFIVRKNDPRAGGEVAVG
jgi:DHA2 family multidrug resistance protein